MKTIAIKIPTLHKEVEFEQISDNNVRAGFEDYDGFGINNHEAFNDLVNNMPNGEEITDNIFPNGFESWYETHYFISVHLAETEDLENSLAYYRTARQGMGGLWVLSQELTDEFETINKGRQWDGEWMDELEAWLCNKDTLARQSNMRIG